MSQRRGEMALRARADKANQADAWAMPLFAVGVRKPCAGSTQPWARLRRPHIIPRVMNLATGRTAHTTAVVALRWGR